jgi:hypothetical protein
MAISKEERFEFLKSRQMFADLEETDILLLAEHMDEYVLPAGKVLYSAGDKGNVFYIIFNGSVHVSMLEEDEQEREIGNLETGDKLGVESLLMGTPRATTVTSMEDTTFLVMHKPDFEHMLDRYPSIDEYLTTLMDTRREARIRHFPWLNENELIQILTRRHPIQLWIALLKPFTAILIGLFFLYIAQLTQLETVPYILGYFILAISVFWIIWEWIDWRNDLFILTNQRIVWLEKVVLQDASRREAPLSAVQSVDVKTTMVGRILDYGHVLVRTFTGTGSLTLTNVNHPKQMKGEIEELLLRVRKKTEIIEEEKLRHSIRQSLGLETKSIEDPIFYVEEPQEVESGIISKLFRTREVSPDGRTITYHRHWWVLLTKTWLPVLGFIGMVVFLGYVITNNYTVWNFVLPRLSFFVFWFMGALTIALVVVYHVADWNNDIYMISKDDMLIDAEKKPFGEEISRTAPIKNIISLEHQRTGILRLMLNFGIVRVVVADATLVFYDVHNPAQVQQDIYYRQEQIKLRSEEAEMEQDREHISRWLRAYHDVFQAEEEEKARRFAVDFEDDEEEE